jgi:hypothetical protein
VGCGEGRDRLKGVLVPSYFRFAMSMILRFIRAVVATFISGLISALLVVLFGIVAPMTTLMLIYGKQEVQDAPAHGGAILFLTAPAAGFGAFIFFFFAVIFVYKKLPRSQPLC